MELKKKAFCLLMSFLDQLDGVGVDFVIDAKHLLCPLPLLKLKAQLHKMCPGQVLCIEACDSGSKQDIPAYISLKKYKLLKKSEVNQVYSFWIEKC